jgi:hypothetical protein
MQCRSQVAVLLPEHRHTSVRGEEAVNAVVIKTDQLGQAAHIAFLQLSMVRPRPGGTGLDIFQQRRRLVTAETAIKSKRPAGREPLVRQVLDARMKVNNARRCAVLVDLGAHQFRNSEVAAAVSPVTQQCLE